jgi:hypothetical protein
MTMKIPVSSILLLTLVATTSAAEGPPVQTKPLAKDFVLNMQEQEIISYRNQVGQLLEQMGTLGEENVRLKRVDEDNKNLQKEISKLQEASQRSCGDERK